MDASDLTWMDWWGDADWIVRGVFLLLLALSLLSWTVIIYKSVQLERGIRREAGFARRLRQGGGEPPLSGHYLLQALDPEHPPGRSALEARLGQMVRERRLGLEGGLTFLATTGNSSPFIGLFGTVWGIMHALQALGGGGALSMDMVAGPVAEALVATAAGLFTAIPAVVGYNMLLRRLRLLVGFSEGNAIRLVDLAMARHEHNVTMLRSA